MYHRAPRGARSRALALFALALTLAASLAGAAARDAAAGPAGLVAAYSFDAGSGSTLADVSGNGHAGVVSGAAWTNAGRYGGALTFDGVDDWVTVADAPALDLSTGMTVEAWVRPTALGRWRTVAFKERPRGTAYSLFASQQQGVPVGQVDIAGEKNATASALPPNAWSHLAVTYDGTTLRLYRNGVLGGSRAVGGPIPASSGPLRIGGNSVWSEWFAGQIDELRIYDRALSATEIQTDMNAPVADTQAPSVPQGLAVSTRTTTSVSLTWSASTDDSGVAGYGRYRDGTLVASTAGTSHTFTGLACGTTYTFGVDAYDGAGNRSARSSLTAATSPCAAASGPVAAYSFDAGSGTTLADASGNANHGSIAGAAWSQAGRSGGALSFDGVDDLVTVADAASLDLANALTLEAWVRPDTTAGWRTVVTKETTGNLVYGLFSSADTAPPAGIVTIGSSPLQEIVRGSSALAVGAWRHLALTYDGAALRLYANGVEIGSRPVTGALANTSGPLQIGGNRVWAEWFDGLIDDLRVYGRALSAAEIQTDMATPVAPPPPAPPADTQAPTAPSGLVAGGATQTSLTLSWSASSDDVGVTGYGLYRNGAAAGTTAGTSTTFSGLACGTAYTLGVDAVDAAGNRSARSSLTASTAACSPPPPPPPPTGSTANLWVDPNGGTCVRRATPAAYVDAEACSWNQAYNAAATGDLILVRGGNYGDVTLGPNRTAITAPGITFRAAAGESVVVDDFENGHIAGSTGASNVTLVGPVTARTFRSDRASNIVVDGWNVDCNGCVGVQIFHLEAASNVVVRNSEIQDNTDNSLIWISGTDLTFEGNRIHDAGLRAGSGAHTECMYAWNVTNLTLKRNHFYRCAVMDVFITGSSVANGGYVENNVFEKPWSTTGVISNTAYAFHFRNGGDPSPDPNGWEFRYNTFVGPLSISSENPVGAAGMRVIGNVFLASAPCGKANTVYSHNAFVGSGCGTNALVQPLSTYQSGFTSTGDPGDYSLRSTSVLRDRGDPAQKPAVDLTGAARTDATPDLGAYEYR